MVPLPCKLLVWLASWIVPRGKRRDWRREWNAELWHRAEAGFSPGELLVRARGAFRDAAWFAEREYKRNGFDPFRRPLRLEAAFVLLALIVCALAGSFRYPQLPYLDAGRLVSFERNLSFMGPVDSITNPKAIKLFKAETSVFEEVATFRVYRQPVLSMRVSLNFFDVLGAKPLLGRTLRPDDTQNLVVLPYDVWHSELKGDPKVIGRQAVIEARRYTIIGVMPESFWFRSPRFRFFTTLQSYVNPAGAVARLKPGVTPADALRTARQLSAKVEAPWLVKALDVQPLLVDRRLGDLGFAASIALIGALLGMGYLTLRGIRNLRFRAFLGARIWLALFGLALIRWSFQHPRSAAPLSWELFAFWLFLLLCSAVTCLLAIDHRGRCQVCLGKLRKPVAIGSWASQLLDRPATEYVCLAGHGTLYVAETGNAPDSWSKLDESWKDLFVSSEP